MRVWDSFLRKRGWVKAAAAAPAPPHFLRMAADSDQYAIPDYALADNQLRAMQAVGWVHIAVQVVAQTVAGQRLNVMRRVGEDLEHVSDHPFEALLRRPNPLQSRFELLEATAANYRLAGNAYWWLNLPSGDAPPSELYCLPANRVRVIPGGQVGVVQGYVFDAGAGQEVPLPPDEIVHFRAYHPRNLWMGLSPLEGIARDLESEYKMAEYQLNFFGRDFAKPAGMLAFRGPVSDSELERFTDTWRREYGGTRRQMAVIRAAAGVDYIRTALQQQEMEFLESRTFNKEAIFALLAPGLASILAVNATEANARTGKATLADHAIWPILQAIQEKITNDVLWRYGDGLVCEFDDPRLADTAAELDQIQTASRFFTIDEVRARWYQEEPLADGRGGALAGAAPAAFEEEPPGIEDGKAARAIDVPPEPTADDLFRDEIATWRRWAIKRARAGTLAERAFETRYIEAGLRGAIQSALEAARTPEDVHGVFAAALAWRGYP